MARASKCAASAKYRWRPCNSAVILRRQVGLFSAGGAVCQGSPREIQADELKMRQVVLNLLLNAIKFTPEGGTIEVRAEPRNWSVEVSVTDTGVGIAPEDQEAVFEEFRQMGTPTRRSRAPAWD